MVPCDCIFPVFHIFMIQCHWPGNMGTKKTKIDGLVQERRNSSAFAMEVFLALTHRDFFLSCVNPISKNEVAGTFQVFTTLCFRAGNVKVVPFISCVQCWHVHGHFKTTWLVIKDPSCQFSYSPGLLHGSHFCPELTISKPHYRVLRCVGTVGDILN